MWNITGLFSLLCLSEKSIFQLTFGHTKKVIETIYYLAVWLKCSVGLKLLYKLQHFLPYIPVSDFRFVVSPSCFIYTWALLIDALKLQEVVQHNNFILQMPTALRRLGVRSSRLKLFLPRNKCQTTKKAAPPESRCLLYLPCRSGFVWILFKQSQIRF